MMKPISATGHGASSRLYTDAAAGATMVKIMLQRDASYAPGCFIIARQRRDGRYDGRDKANTVLIQSDWDFPGVARTFGGSFEDDQTAEAAEWLAENVGAEAEDPGYFDER